MARSAPSPSGRATQERSGSRAAPVIDNVIDVLRCFSVEQPVQGVTEIAAQVGLHKSSVSRILATLEQKHIVERDTASRKFRLGLGLLGIAGPLLANLDVRRVSLPMLEELSATTGETIALQVWDGSEAITVEQVASRQNIKHTTPLGTRYATAVSASVQAFLADLPVEHVRELLTNGAPLLPEASPGVEDFLAELTTVRERGYAVNYGATSPEEVGIAALARDHRGRAAAAVLLAAPVYRVPRERVPELAEACLAAARRVSARLGAPPP